LVKQSIEQKQGALVQTWFLYRGQPKRFARLVSHRVKKR